MYTVQTSRHLRHVYLHSYHITDYTYLTQVNKKHVNEQIFESIQFEFMASIYTMHYKYSSRYSSNSWSVYTQCTTSIRVDTVRIHGQDIHNALQVFESIQFECMVSIYTMHYKFSSRYSSNSWPRYTQRTNIVTSHVM